MDARRIILANFFAAVDMYSLIDGFDFLLRWICNNNLLWRCADDMNDCSRVDREWNRRDVGILSIQSIMLRWLSNNNDETSNKGNSLERKSANWMTR